MTHPEQEALSVSEVPGWRPIETAPRDGTRILLAGMPYGPKVDTGGWWSTTYNRSLKAYNTGWSTSPGYPCSPTHWMPLPAPPASALRAASEASQ